MFNKINKAILDIIEINPKSRKDLSLNKRQACKKYKIGMIKNSDIFLVYKKLLQDKKIKQNLDFEKILRKRSIRTMSGIAPIAVLTKPYECPGKCVYCPHEENVPTSYLSNEPAVMRAIRNDYDPYRQVQSRIESLENNGHNPTKIELIVIGGSWSILPMKYKYWYIKECFRGANEYSGKNDVVLTQNRDRNKNDILIQCRNSDICDKDINELKTKLKEEQMKNETTKYKIIGITLETRPDYINKSELIEMRELGCTRVEIGVQIIDDEVLDFNQRGHGVKEIINATRLLREFGFKITYHLMPGLPGSNVKNDVKKFKKLFNDKKYHPDQIKFYPTVVTKGSLLYEWWKNGKYKPYSNKELVDLIIECKKYVPRYVRIIRLIRDIPGESIIAGNKITNLRQIMQDNGVICKCIRCREPRDKSIDFKNIKFEKEVYETTTGTEYFLSYNSSDNKVLYGFCRLFIPNKKIGIIKTLNNSAIIRELHVYGELMQNSQDTAVQHIGLGKMLIEKAREQVLKSDFNKIAVISGVGVRGYYKKLGYELRGNYMVIDLVN